MRATISDVIRRPSALPNWWYELKARHLWWWREVLREPGQGWLCWAVAYRTCFTPWPEEYVVAPPVRRALWRLRGEYVGVYIDDDRRRLWR